MQVCLVIEKMFPQAIRGNNYSVTLFPDGHWEITKWELNINLPTSDELQAQWDIMNLDITKQNKINEISNINNSNITFTSSALGSVHTYLADDSAMAKFNAEYTYVNSEAYDNSPILWYTFEEGGIEHTKDQFNQVWLDGRNFIASNFTKWDSLVKQVNSITTDNQTVDQAITQINLISW